MIFQPQHHRHKADPAFEEFLMPGARHDWFQGADRRRATCTTAPPGTISGRARQRTGNPLTSRPMQTPGG
jgi:hypothetical protein